MTELLRSFFACTFILVGSKSLLFAADVAVALTPTPLPASWIAVMVSPLVTFAGALLYLGTRALIRLVNSTPKEVKP